MTEINELFNYTHKTTIVYFRYIGAQLQCSIRKKFYFDLREEPTSCSLEENYFVKKTTSLRMAPKKNISEETFNAFRAEVERNSQYLVDQLLQKINKLEEKCNNLEDENNRKIEEVVENYERKIGEVVENYEKKIELIEVQLNDVKLKYGRDIHGRHDRDQASQQVLWRPACAQRYQSHRQARREARNDRAFRLG